MRHILLRLRAYDTDKDGTLSLSELQGALELQLHEHDMDHVAGQTNTFEDKTEQPVPLITSMQQPFENTRRQQAKETLQQDTSADLFTLMEKYMSKNQVFDKSPVVMYLHRLN